MYGVDACASPREVGGGGVSGGPRMPPVPSGVTGWCGDRRSESEGERSMPESRRTLSGGGGCGMGGTAPPLLTSICISARRRFSSMGMLLMTSPALCVSCTKVATGDDHGTPQRVTCDRQPCVSRQRGAGHREHIAQRNCTQGVPAVW